MTPIGDDDDDDLTPKEERSLIIYTLAGLAVFVLYVVLRR